MKDDPRVGWGISVRESTKRQLQELAKEYGLHPGEVVETIIEKDFMELVAKKLRARKDIKLAQDVLAKADEHKAKAVIDALKLAGFLPRMADADCSIILKDGRVAPESVQTGDDTKESMDKLI